jgi:hypothetical protein
LPGILSQFNPWWRSEKPYPLPAWKKASFQELFDWTLTPPLQGLSSLAPAILLNGKAILENSEKLSIMI